MIERHVSFSVLPGQDRRLRELLRRALPAAGLQMPGLIECILLRESDHADHYQMVFRWESADDAAAWRTSAVHQALQPDLAALHIGMEIVAYTQVA